MGWLGLTSSGGVSTSGGSVGDPNKPDGGPESNFALGSKNATSTYANQMAAAQNAQAGTLQNTGANYAQNASGIQALGGQAYGMALGAGSAAPQVSANGLDRASQVAALGGLNSVAGQQQSLASQQQSLVPQQQAWAGQQQSLAAQQQALGAAGISANPALAQLNQGQDAAMQQSLAMARSGHTIGGGAGNYQAAMAQNAQTNQQTNQAAATLRANQDVQNAQFKLGALGAANQTLGAAGQSLDAVNQTYAGVNQATAGAGQSYGAAAGQANALTSSDNSLGLANAGLSQNQQGLNTQQASAYGQIGSGLDSNAVANSQLGLGYNQLGLGYNQLASNTLQTQLGANENYQNSINGYSLQQQGLNNQQTASNEQFVASLAGGGAQAASDVNAKKDIVAAEDDPKNRGTLSSIYHWLVGPGNSGDGSSDAASRLVHDPNNPSQMVSPYASIGAASNGARPNDISQASSPSALFAPQQATAFAPSGGGVPLQAPSTWGGASTPVQPSFTPQQPDYAALDAAYAQSNPYAQSDVHSKERIQQLEGQLAALGGGQPAPRAIAAFAPAYPTTQAPNTAALDQAYQREGGAPAIDLRPAQGYSYAYKDPERHGAGRFFGPMAQNLEETPAGASVVKKAPDGTKMINTSRLSLVNTAAISEQQRRMQAMEAQVAALGGGSSYPTPRPPNYDQIDLQRGMQRGGVY